MVAVKDIIHAFQRLGKLDNVSEDTIAIPATCVGRGYCPRSTKIHKIRISDVNVDQRVRVCLLQWVVFMSIFCQLIPRCVCVCVWCQVQTPDQPFLDQGFNGFCLGTNESLKATTRKVKPTPGAVLELVRWSGRRSRCTPHNCTCDVNNLMCTDVCSCVNCDNTEPHIVVTDSDDDD